MGIGSRIRDARKAAGLTQAELAKMVHLSRSHIGAIELDRYNPSLSTLTAIAAAVGKPVAGLVDSDGRSEVYNPDNSIDVYERTNEPPPSYYNDPEVAQMANEIKDNPDMRILFDASRDLKKESIEEVVKFIEFQKAKERGDWD